MVSTAVVFAPTGKNGDPGDIEALNFWHHDDPRIHKLVTKLLRVRWAVYVLGVQPSPGRISWIARVTSTGEFGGDNFVDHEWKHTSTPMRNRKSKAAFRYQLDFDPASFVSDFRPRLLRDNCVRIQNMFLPNQKGMFFGHNHFATVNMKGKKKKCVHLPHHCILRVKPSYTDDFVARVRQLA